MIVIVGLLIGAAIGVAARSKFGEYSRITKPIAAAAGAATSALFLLVAYLTGFDGFFAFILLLALPAATVAVISRAMPGGTPEGVISSGSPSQNSLPEISRSDSQDQTAATSRLNGHEFEVESVMYYDGSGRRLGPSVCTIRSDRIIIDDARGGVSQILIRDIAGTGMKTAFPPAKQLRINLPTSTYDIYCKSKAQKEQMEYFIGQAIRGRL
jgi:hypothetical protein